MYTYLFILLFVLIFLDHIYCLVVGYEHVVEHEHVVEPDVVEYEHADGYAHFRCRRRRAAIGVPKRHGTPMAAANVHVSDNKMLVFDNMFVSDNKTVYVIKKISDDRRINKYNVINK